MSEREIHITYDTLIDLLRRERNKPELQKLDSTFYEDVIQYFVEKQTILEGMQKRLDKFSDTAQQQNTQDQLNNARKVLRDIYERRERKIFDMALNKSRTNSDIIDTASLLTREKEFFNETVELLNKYRQSVLDATLQMRQTVQEKPSEEPKTGDIMLRFLHAVPKFLGPDLSVYGPYEAEDVAKLSPDLAKVLLSKGRAEEIHEE